MGTGRLADPTKLSESVQNMSGNVWTRPFGSILAFLCFALCLGAAQTAHAHTIRPALVSVTFNDDATFTVEIEANAESLIARIGTEHEDTDESPNAQIYNRLRTLEPAELKAEFDAFAREYLDNLSLAFDGRDAELTFVSIDVPQVGDVELARDSLITLTGRVPAGAQEAIWSYPETYGSNVLRLQYADSEEAVSFFLQTGEVSDPFALEGQVVPRSRMDMAIDYIDIGFRHILPLGLDHILFVLGIFLLSLHLKPIILQVTAFTLAHTITLALSIYGVVSLPASIVEPLIALSIVYVGVENILLKELKPWRIVIVFLFGLLHGLGFAGVLTEIGLPDSEFLTALITFNIGVELGQLAVIGLALLAVGWFRGESWYRERIVIPGSIVISLIGAYWTIERVFF